MRGCRQRSVPPTSSRRFPWLISDGRSSTIIALAVVLLFGWKRMPDMARSLGRSARIFKSEIDQMRTTPDAGR